MKDEEEASTLDSKPLYSSLFARWRVTTPTECRGTMHWYHVNNDYLSRKPIISSGIFHVLIFTSVILRSDTHSCNHIVPKPHEVVHNVHLGEPVHVMKRRSLDQQLRIHLVYDSGLSNLPTEKETLVKDVLIPTAVSYWERTLQVRRTDQPVKLLRSCLSDVIRFRDGDPYPYCVDNCSKITQCGPVIVPEQYLEVCRIAHGSMYMTVGYGGLGVENADFILFVSTTHEERCVVGSAVAYAAYCQLEGALDRPVAGYVNLCPNDISTEPHNLHQMHATLKHEILHALGFSSGLYAFFRDPQGEPLTKRSPSTGKPDFNYETELYQWSEKVVREVTRPSWRVRGANITRTFSLLVTPRVVEEVRKHFACPTLEGAELENQGTLGTALTHWEKRVFENEAMTGSFTQHPVISRVTLALMEDTGWYQANYDFAEELTWGRGLGCDFVKWSCLEWMQTRAASGAPIYPFCDRVRSSPIRTECSPNQDSVAVCNLVEYRTKLPSMYQFPVHQPPCI
ncbi:Leishmanolysin-like peptidase [Lamellibrachia satsuma]|nr:Leishmanolysin-like peptidase [Lamellibrachia satsuma]